jgi:hypothetical protein
LKPTGQPPQVGRVHAVSDRAEAKIVRELVEQLAAIFDGREVLLPCEQIVDQETERSCVEILRRQSEVPLMEKSGQWRKADALDDQQCSSAIGTVRVSYGK